MIVVCPKCYQHLRTISDGDGADTLPPHPVADAVRRPSGIKVRKLCRFSGAFVEVS